MVRLPMAIPVLATIPRKVLVITLPHTRYKREGISSRVKQKGRKTDY
jgi:hypothetical protein